VTNKTETVSYFLFFYYLLKSSSLISLLFLFEQFNKWCIVVNRFEKNKKSFDFGSLNNLVLNFYFLFPDFSHADF